MMHNWTTKATSQTSFEIIQPVISEEMQYRDCNSVSIKQKQSRKKGRRSATCILTMESALLLWKESVCCLVFFVGETDLTTFGNITGKFRKNPTISHEIVTIQYNRPIHKTNSFCSAILHVDDGRESFSWIPI